MSYSENKHLDFAVLGDRFPDHVRQLKRLSERDPDFADICADYCQAACALTAFLNREDRQCGPEIEDYRGLVAELGTEIEGRLFSGSNIIPLRAAKAGSGGPNRS